MLDNVFHNPYISGRFSNLLGIKCTKFYPYSFRFDTFIKHCIGVYFFLDTVFTNNT